MFAHDRDLINIEPNLFRDVAWLAQRRSAGNISSDAGEVTISGFDVNLEDGAVEAGLVIMIDSVAYEVIERLTATTATLSRLRDDPAGPVIATPAFASRPYAVHSMRPQIAIAHRRVLRMIGIDPEGIADGPAEADILNPDGLRLVESLGALAVIYSAAAALSGPDSALQARSAMYRARFNEERQRAVALIDLNGDGEPDATRRLSVLPMRRS